QRGAEKSGVHRPSRVRTHLFLLTAVRRRRRMLLGRRRAETPLLRLPCCGVPPWLTLPAHAGGFAGSTIAVASRGSTASWSEDQVMPSGPSIFDCRVELA